MTDPTPARDLLQAGLNESFGVSWSALQESPNIVALLRRADEAAALRAEVERLRAALDDLLAEQKCPSTSGGTEDQWCMDHGYPMVDENRCSLIFCCEEVLAASVPAAPEPRP